MTIVIVRVHPVHLMNRIIINCPMEGGRLSRHRHCSKGAQPVPKAVYRTSCCDKPTLPQCNLNLGPLTLQSGTLTTQLLRPDMCVCVVSMSPVTDVSCLFVERQHQTSVASRRGASRRCAPTSDIDSVSFVESSTDSDASDQRFVLLLSMRAVVLMKMPRPRTMRPWPTLQKLLSLW